MVRNRGFTLIELLVVISIIALLASVVLASLNSAREKGRLAAGRQFDASVKHGIGDRIVGEWLFDDSTNPWVDTSGLGHTGVPSGTVASPTGGYNGKGAASFDGSNDFLSIGSSWSDFFPMTTFTICAWTKTPGLGSGMTLNGIMSLTYALTLGIDGSGNFRTDITNGTSNVALITSPASGNLMDDRFHHVCVSADSTTRKAYIDGALRGKLTVSWPGSVTDGGSIGFGAGANNPPLYRFNGLIDDARIYATDLSSSEVGKLYAEGLRAHSPLAASI